MMALQLHLGCGQNFLPDPWQNYDRDVDLCSPLPFSSGTAKFVFAEHVIEHLSFVDGLGFLREVHRVLMPGGTLRVSFPDVTRFVDGQGAEDYYDLLRKLGEPATGIRDIFRFILLRNEHRSCWTRDSADAALAAIGFLHTVRCGYGASARLGLRNIDRHHESSGWNATVLETTIIEATR